MKILNFGSCNIDFVYEVDNIVRPGETIHVNELKQYPGGKGLNQSIALARAGSEVWHAGCIGEDGLFLKELMEENGIHTEYLQVVEDRTGHAIIQVEPSAQNSILVCSGANGQTTKPYIDQVLSGFKAGDYIVLQNEINNICYIIQKAKEFKLKVILNPSPCNNVLKEIDLRDISYLVLNEIEASFFSEIEDPYDSILQMIRKYPNLNVVLTLGEKGCFYTDGGMVYYHPAYQVNAVDTTAAGDTFMGYFVSGLSQKRTLAECVKMANVAAALAIQKKGAAPSIPMREYVMKMCDSMVLNEHGGVEWKKKLVEHYMTYHVKDANLETLAHMLNYSSAYLSRWISGNMGQPFSELLQKKRCLLAAEYLKTTDMSIHDIIAEVGYNNEGFFRKIFWEMFGMMPKEYRNSERQKGGK